MRALGRADCSPIDGHVARQRCFFSSRPVTQNIPSAAYRAWSRPLHASPGWSCFPVAIAEPVGFFDDAAGAIPAVGVVPAATAVAVGGGAFAIGPLLLLPHPGRQTAISDAIASAVMELRRMLG